MERNNIVVSPQIEGVSVIYDIWLRNHYGSEKTFYEFMVTPTPEREMFIDACGDLADLSFSNGAAELTLKG